MLAPCFETTYALHTQYALKLYDCVLPKIKSMVPHCSKCTTMRMESGIEDPPVTEKQLQQLTEYWRVDAVE